MIGNLVALLPKPVRWTVLLLGVKLFFTLLAVFFFSKYSPLVDADLYLSNYYVIDPHLRTRFIQNFVTLLSNFGGAIFVHWSFGVLSLMGVFYYYWRGGGRWQLCLLLLLPSTLIWTSVIGKEAIFYGTFTLSIAIWVQFVARKCTATDYIFLALAMLVCALLRPHYGVVLVWLFLSAVLVNKFKNTAWPWLCLLAILGAGVVFAFAWDALLLRGFGGIEPSARASRFALFGIDQKTSAGFETYKSLVPLGALLGIIGPMPTELFARPEFIPFFLEGVLILLFPAGVYFYASRQSFEGQKRFMAIFWLCLVPAILALLVLHAPFGLLNPGSATRWRVNFEAAFHMAPLLLLYGFLDNDLHENHSFPP